MKITVYRYQKTGQRKNDAPEFEEWDITHQCNNLRITTKGGETYLVDPLKLSKILNETEATNEN